MRTVILIFGVFITGVIAFSNVDTRLKGTWVMKHEFTVSNLPVMRFNYKEGILSGKIDVPEAEEYDRDLHFISTKGDSVHIEVYKNGTIINAVLANDSTLTGTMIMDNDTYPVTFLKNNHQ